jgi:hypothetical protein
MPKRAPSKAKDEPKGRGKFVDTVDNTVDAPKEELAKKKYDKLRHSVFFMLINPNQATLAHTKSMADLRAKMKQFVEKHLLDEEDAMRYVKVIKPGDSIEKVKKVKTDTSLEFGADTHKLHLHSIVYVQHYSKVHLDLQKLRDDVVSEFSTEDERQPRPYIDVQARNDDVRTVTDYVHKYGVPAKWKKLS